jgi:hypothetical protein
VRQPPKAVTQLLSFTCAVPGNSAICSTTRQNHRTSSDRCIVLRKLTEAGHKKYLEKVPVMLASWNEILQDFEESEVGDLVRLLGKLLRSFEDHQ